METPGWQTEHGTKLTNLQEVLIKMISSKVVDITSFWNENVESMKWVFESFDDFQDFYGKVLGLKNPTLGKGIQIASLEHCETWRHIFIKWWIKSMRNHGAIVFVDLMDSTGTIQCCLNKEQAAGLRMEEWVELWGHIDIHRGKTEIQVDHIKRINPSQPGIMMQPRSESDPFNWNTVDHLLRNRHLYLRNPKLVAMMKFRNLLQSEMRSWFSKNDFISFDAPILTPVPLYEDDSAIKAGLSKQNVFMTQCVWYYLEAAAHGLEKVYNMGPSFRWEEGRSKRHLMEYWHIKAEWCWDNFEGVIWAVEEIIPFLTRQLKAKGGDFLEELGVTLCEDGLKAPYPRITYRECCDILAKEWFDIEFWKSLGSKEEEFLSHNFFPNQPFWVTWIPRSIEPFPYSIDPQDSEVCMVADLITSNWCGELLWVAEKIYDFDMLLERMKEKNRDTDPRYEFVREVHASWCVPHVAFWMGLERLMRWLIWNDHVRDCHGFPRIFDRIMNP